MLTLHGANASPFVRKTMAVLALKGLEYDHKPQMPFARDPEYKKISPLEKIPCLQDGDLTVADSKVINRYLESAYPEKPVYPTDKQDKARAEWFEEYGGSVLTEAAGSIFFQRFMKPMVLKQEPDEEHIEKVVTKMLPPMLDYLESEVPEEGFLFGDDMGVADIAIVTPFVNAGYGGYELDGERWPKFTAFAARVRAHPVMAELLKVEAEMFGNRG